MTVALLKAVHIAALLLWMAGLLSLPLMLSRHEEADEQRRYARIRKFTHYSYTRIVTPSAVIAITAGVALIFLRDLFTLWMLAKLAIVGLLVILHAYIGHIVLKMGEEAGDEPPAVWPLLAGLGVLIPAILLIVLVKPALNTEWIPALFQQPAGRQLPLDEVPN